MKTTPGDEGNWFAAAKERRASTTTRWRSRAAPRLIRRRSPAQRGDFAEKQPAFAVGAGLLALHWLVQGYGYEITGADVWDAYRAYAGARGRARPDGPGRCGSGSGGSWRARRTANASSPASAERDLKVLSRAFARLVSDLEIPNLRFHDLRHDAASTLTMAGVAQRAVMEILGHRDPRMTMRYQHLSPGHLKDAMRALDQSTARPADQQGNGPTSGLRSLIGAHRVAHREIRPTLLRIPAKVNAQIGGR